MKLKIKTPNVSIHVYIYMVLSLLGTFWMLSLFEFIMTSDKNIWVSIGMTVLFRFLNDFWAVILIGLILFPLYLGLVALSKKVGVIILKILFVIIVLSQFALVEYSLTTLINLGADLISYSYDDIMLTVSSTESVSIVSLLPFLIFPLIFLGLNYLIKKKRIEERKLSLVFSVFIVLFGCLKLLAFEASEVKYKNKIHYLVSDIIRYQLEKNEVDLSDFENRNDYPLLRSFNETEDVLAPFFNIKEEKPNVVIIIVEGLGSEFVGDYDYSGFTPFLDSLITKSLFWENFISTTGRTFGVLPSLLGSVPYGDKGFLEIKNTPSHISLINALKANGYTTSFFAGHNSSFDRVINFLEYNGIDNVIDESQFGPEYIKAKENDVGFAWGFPDEEIYRKSLASLDDLKQPRLDIIMTLSNHEPYEFPEKEEFLRKVENILNSNRTFGLDKNEVRDNMDIFSTLLYTDTALKNYIEGYSKRPEFENTIFIITGDHRLIPITQKDKLCRYHVPFYIYSPLLKKAERFKSISSHLDVAPSLLSFLMNNYEFNKLEETAWLGQGIDTARYFRNIHQIPLMRYKGKISDFIYKDYMYADGVLFKINEKFGTYKVKETEIKKQVDSVLKAFKKLNAYVTQRNKIFPDSLNIYVKPIVKFSKEELAVVQLETENLNFDEIFKVAREIAMQGDYEKARLFCNYILNELPNHFDARILKGRTLAWDKNYIEAEFEFLNVLKRSPYYSDAYMAILDLYWWSGQDEKSIDIGKKAMEYHLTDPEISFKLAKALKRMNDFENATSLIDSIILKHPENTAYLTFKQSLIQHE